MTKLKWAIRKGIIISSKTGDEVNEVPPKFHGIKIFNLANLASDNYDCVGIRLNIIWGTSPVGWYDSSIGIESTNVETCQVGAVVESDATDDRVCSKVAWSSEADTSNATRRIVYTVAAPLPDYLDARLSFWVNWIQSCLCRSQVVQGWLDCCHQSIRAPQSYPVPCKTADAHSPDKSWDQRSA